MQKCLPFKMFRKKFFSIFEGAAFENFLKHLRERERERNYVSRYSINMLNYFCAFCLVFSLCLQDLPVMDVGPGQTSATECFYENNQLPLPSSKTFDGVLNARNRPP